MIKWNVTFPFPPVQTPRPKYTFRGKGKVHTYYGEKYDNYLIKMHDYLEENNLYNETFFKVAHAKYGVMADINFYVQTPKSQKKINYLMKTTAPDIDNLLKATLDGIFNKKYIKERDSRIVGVKTLKFNEMDNPRTEVTLYGLEDMVDGK